jgi:hypothetical protein
VFPALQKDHRSFTIGTTLRHSLGSKLIPSLRSPPDLSEGLGGRWRSPRMARTLRWRSPASRWSVRRCLVTICNNFAIPTSCGPKIFLAPNIEPRPLSCGALRGRFAAASRGRRRTVSLAPATTLPIGCLSNRWPQIGVETHRLVQSSHQASRPRLSNADRHQVPRRKLASWAPCSYRVAIRSEVG